MGKLDELCPKINAMFCFLKKLEMSELSENPFYWLYFIKRKGSKKFLVNAGSSKCLRKEKHALISGPIIPISPIYSRHKLMLSKYLYLLLNVSFFTQKIHRTVYLLDYHVVGS